MTSKHLIIEVANEKAAIDLGQDMDWDKMRYSEFRSMPHEGHTYVMITANRLFADTILREWLRQRKIAIIEED